jgi:MFS family permease
MASVDAARLAARSDAAMTTPFATLFFPSSSRTASLLATLAVFAIAFVARPFGSILLSHVGDHYGRKPALAIAVLHMVLTTFTMGLSPTHATIGVTAPTLLVAA